MRAFYQTTRNKVRLVTSASLRRPIRKLPAAIEGERVIGRYPDAARGRRLLGRGVEVGEIRHKTPIEAWDGCFAPGLDPARGDYTSFANLSDPDGNSWVLQERGYRNV